MPIRLFTGTISNSVASTNLITAASNDLIVIAADALYAAIGAGVSHGVASASGATNVDVMVQGSLYGNSRGIDTLGISGISTITVAATGTLVGFESNAATLSGTIGRLSNSGLIQSYGSGFTIYSGADVTEIVNSGTIQAFGDAAAISLGSAMGGTIFNSGVIRAVTGNGAVQGDPVAAIYSQLASANDVVWNDGEIYGNIALSGGNDLYQGSGRVIGSIGTITSGFGNDTLIGDRFDDVIIDTAGGNWLVGGDGADTITIGNGFADRQLDYVFGGIAGGADTSARDRLVFAFESGGTGVNVILTGGYATSADNVNLLAVFSGIENVTGSTLADALIGNAAGNILNGGGGGDWLVGGGGTDTFEFTTAADAASDQVRDLRRTEGDRIDLSEIDANTGGASDDAFILRTAHTANAAGEVVVTSYGTSATIDLYINADNVVDGTIVVVFGEASMTSLLAADFIL